MPSRIAITRLATRRDPALVGDDDERDAVLGVELAEEVDDFAAGLASRGCRSARRTAAASAGRTARARSRRAASARPTARRACGARSPTRPTRRSASRAAPVDVLAVVARTPPAASRSASTVR